MNATSAALVPITVAIALLTTACGAAPSTVEEAGRVGPLPTVEQRPTPPADTARATSRTELPAETPVAARAREERPTREATVPSTRHDGAREASPSDRAEDRRASTRPGVAASLGPSDLRVSAQEIRLGTINMHSAPLARIAIAPLVQGLIGTAVSINDRGGVGRRVRVVDCDSGTGEVSPLG